MSVTSDRSYPNWTGDCLHCGNAFSLYLRPSRTPPRFCSLKCSNNWPPHKAACAKYGADNARWLGDKARPQSGRKRATKRFSPVSCGKCGGTKRLQRHHVDGNTLNNEETNIHFLCQRCHMIEDGRLEAGTKRCLLNARKGEDNIKAKLKGTDIPAIRRRIAAGDTLASIGRDFGVSECTIGRIKDGSGWTHIGATA